MGWHRWADVVNECKLKLVVEAIKNPDSLMGKLVNGAIESLQQDHGGSQAILTTNEAQDTIGHGQDQKEWLWTVWEWTSVNGIRVAHSTPDMDPRRVHDYLLVDRCPIEERKHVRKHLGEAKWASDIHSECGT